MHTCFDKHNTRSFIHRCANSELGRVPFQLDWRVLNVVDMKPAVTTQNNPMFERRPKCKDTAKKAVPVSQESPVQMELGHPRLEQNCC